jgi:bla regulator protein BlaR1
MAGFNPFLNWLAENALAGTVLTGVIIVAKRLLAEKIAIRWLYFLWFILIARLIMPFQVESPVSVFNFIRWLPLVQSVVHPSAADTAFQNAEPTVGLFDAVLPEDYSLAVAANRRIHPFFPLWLTGAAVYFYLIILHNLKIARFVKRAEKSEVNDADLTALLQKCREKMGIKAGICLMQSPHISIPALYGIFRPRILLPENAVKHFNLRQLEHILLHELSHYRRRDIPVNLLCCLIKAFYWFNPLINYAFSRMHQDQEKACDSMALSFLPLGANIDYGTTMISLAQRAIVSRAASVTLFTGNRKLIKDRITGIAGYHGKNTGETAKGAALVLILACLLLGNPSQSTEQAEEMKPWPGNLRDEDLSPYFQGYEGCFILYDRAKDVYAVYNREQADRRITPLSTFKIFGALFGLESGILKNASTVLKWDGVANSVTVWNQDQTLSSAMKYSVNWYFQRVNLSLGRTKLMRYLAALGYGNERVGEELGEFWLDSSLRISPWETVEQLRKFYSYQIPFSRRNIDIVKRVIRISTNGPAALSGKTGSGIEKNRETMGWFVGYVETEGNQIYFATHIRAGAGADGKTAREITLRILKDKSVW